MPSGEPTPRQWELVAAYRERNLSVKELLATFAATRTELDSALSRAKEPFRRPASAKPGRNLRRRPVFDLAALPGHDDARLLERRLERLLAERIAELEDRSLPGRSVDPADAAKALALNVRTLAALRRTTADSGKDHDETAAHTEAPRSLAALRDELYGHLQRIREEERAGGGAGRPAAERGRDGGDASPLADLLPEEPAAAG